MYIAKWIILLFYIHQRMEEKNLRRDDRALPDEEGHPPIFTKPFKVELLVFSKS